MTVLSFRQRRSASDLWDRYARLVREAAYDPAKRDDPAHLMECRRAHQRFLQAFGEQYAQAS